MQSINMQPEVMVASRDEVNDRFVPETRQLNRDSSTSLMLGKKSTDYEAMDSQTLY